MITSADEYYAALFKINKNGNIPSLAVLLPQSEYIYNIDLDSRTIESPEYLSVLDDHVSETIYFVVDRFFDNLDLSTTACIIQYVNALGDKRVYQVPFYDIETYSSINKMLIPWCIEGEATKAAGNVTYSIRFFKTDELTHQYITFNLNTLPATSKIKDGLRITDVYSRIEGLTAETFSTGETTYYIQDEDGNYIEATTFDESQKYYIVTEGYNQYASNIEELLHRVSLLERDTQAYWYDASDRSDM